MNTCLVFRRSREGLSYDANHTGPLERILDPNLNARSHTNLSFASNLNGSCNAVCPVKDNSYGQISECPRLLVANRQAPWAKQTSLALSGWILPVPKARRTAFKSADSEFEHLPVWATYNKRNAWTKGRDTPELPDHGTFYNWYSKNRIQQADASRPIE